MAKVLKPDGTWYEGKAAPKLLREDLRQLPGELHTQEIEVDDKVHEDDSQHVIDAILYDWKKQQDKLEKEGAPTPIGDVLKARWGDVTIPKVGERAPLRQILIDLVKLRILAATHATNMKRLRRGQNPSFRVQHLWFPEDNVNRYELREGNPPARSQLPKHLKDFDLVFDPLCPPERIVDAMAAAGIALLSVPHDKAEQIRKDLS